MTINGNWCILTALATRTTGSGRNVFIHPDSPYYLASNHGVGLIDPTAKTITWINSTTGTLHETWTTTGTLGATNVVVPVTRHGANAVSAPNRRYTIDFRQILPTNQGLTPTMSGRSSGEGR